MAVSVSQLLYISAWGYLEYPSIVTSIYVSILLFTIGPAKSIWISSFGSYNGGSSLYLFFGIRGFKFLPVLVHCLHLCASATISRCIWGYHISWAK